MPPPRAPAARSSYAKPLSFQFSNGRRARPIASEGGASYRFQAGASYLHTPQHRLQVGRVRALLRLAPARRRGLALLGGGLRGRHSPRRAAAAPTAPETIRALNPRTNKKFGTCG